MDADVARYYRVLDLDPGAPADRIRETYEDLIQIWDPQRFAKSPRLEALAEHKLHEIIQAYRELTLLVDAAPMCGPISLPLIADHNVSAPVEEPPPLPKTLWVFETPPMPSQPAASSVIRKPPLCEPDAVIGKLLQWPRKTVRARVPFIALCIALLIGGGFAVYENRLARPAYVASQLPETGADVVPPHGRSGTGSFHISNQSGRDAAVRVAARERPAEALRLVYVRAATGITIPGIDPGVYFVSFCLEPLNNETRKFGPPVGPYTVHARSGQGDEYELTITPPK